MENEYSKELLQKLCDQENRYQFEHFSRRDAKRLGEMLYETGLVYGKELAIEIRMNGMTIYKFMPDGTRPQNEIWLSAKVKTVEYMQISSLHMAAMLALEGRTLEDKKLDSKQCAAVGGCFPLMIRNTGVIGTICVSGLQHFDDHQVIIDTLEKFANW